VLFSNAEVSKFVRENFIAAWESVRPVPTVEIDFGSGKKLKRTVNGNIATQICTPEGRVIDIVPGMMTAEAYLGSLRDALVLYRIASEGDFESVLHEYHEANATGRARFVEVPDVAKAAIERPMKVLLRLEETAAEIPDASKRMIETPIRRLSVEEEALRADTELNLKERKPRIHAKLAEKPVTPEEITKWLYREILHCDLDDPYLGLAVEAFRGGAYGD